MHTIRKTLLSWMLVMSLVFSWLLIPPAGSSGNEAPIFAQRVYSDIRNMVRRDRNHPSVWMWEPILNETWYPADFAKKVQDIVNEEYPYPLLLYSLRCHCKRKRTLSHTFYTPANRW